MECFEQSTKSLESKIKKATNSLGLNFYDFELYSGDRTISFKTAGGIDKFQLEAIKRKSGYKFSSIQAFDNYNLVVLEK